MVWIIQSVRAYRIFRAYLWVCVSSAANCEKEKGLTVIALYSTCGQRQLRAATQESALAESNEICPCETILTLLVDNR